MSKKIGNNKSEKTYIVEEVIKEINLKDTDIVFIHKYNTPSTEDICGTVQELLEPYKRKKVMLVNKCYGGIKHNYSATLIVIY